MAVSLAPSELVTLLGDRFAGPPSFTTGKRHVPGLADPVALNPLGETVVQAALLGLEHDGHLRLEQAPKSAFFGLRKTHTVLVSRVGDGAPVGRVEAGLLGAIGAEPIEVDEAVYRWFGEDHSWPQAHVIDEAVDGLVDRGAVVRTETQEKGLIRTKTTVAFALPDTTRSALASADVAALQALLAGADGRSDLLKTLAAEVKQGLTRRREADSSDGDWPD